MWPPSSLYDGKRRPFWRPNLCVRESLIGLAEQFLPIGPFPFTRTEETQHDKIVEPVQNVSQKRSENAPQPIKPLQISENTQLT